MKNKLFTLSMLSALFLASGASAVPAGIVTATSDFTVNQYTGLKLSAGEPKVFTGRINQGDVLISLKVEIPDAPEGTKVAIAGDKNTSISVDGTVESETGGIVARLDDVENYSIEGSEYIPPSVNKSADSSAIIVTEATELTFRSVHSYTVGKDLDPGTYTYNFVAQAFIE
ncbi:hypothetical protein [Cedecea sp. NFIX57]|uniref:hypothetical protein n=1 Tax=Cedecea sp. NFIX57 TaxID=1566286 RepID=UPI000A0AD89C|nr:hypothetical protein [Cedecea sp. NFIX57]SMG25590.1 hypothetical protein SAMN03159353_1005108 [Cedecea sp. NFIX57]